MKDKKRLSCSLVAMALLLNAAFAHPANAMSTLLTDFVEESREQIQKWAPTLVANFPHARFLVSGISTASGKWTFVRVEDADSCESDLCPTVIIVKETEWKVLIMAKKQVEVFANLGSVRCTFDSKDGFKVILRYIDGEKTLYVAR